MQYILKKLSYEIINTSGNNNKYACIVDWILLIIYSSISLFNAIKIWLPNNVIIFFNLSTGNIPSLAIIVINIIVLIRINLSLYIKSKNNMKKELQKMKDTRKVASLINISTWDKRMQIVVWGYIIDAVVALFNIFYGTTVSGSLSVIVIIAIIETFINNTIDNLEIRYEAIPIIYKK